MCVPGFMGSLLLSFFPYKIVTGELLRRIIWKISWQYLAVTIAYLQLESWYIFFIIEAFRVLMSSDTYSYSRKQEMVRHYRTGCVTSLCRSTSASLSLEWPKLVIKCETQATNQDYLPYSMPLFFLMLYLASCNW